MLRGCSGRRLLDKKSSFAPRIQRSCKTVDGSSLVAIFTSSGMPLTRSYTALITGLIKAGPVGPKAYILVAGK